MVGEAAVVNDRTLNQVLQQASKIIHQKNAHPLDKINALHNYITKMRREVFYKED